ncbi:MAG: T9SS type A sorting domain-containing protein [Chitinophagales bacterium]|nr:T9SS type A sorting domain-containing protein [Chitinophagales bacterium]
MKKKVLLSLLALLSIFALQSKAVLDGISKMGEYHVGNTVYELFLPDEPYVYNNVTVPDYYILSENGWSSSFGTGNNVAPALFSEPYLPQDNDIVTLGRVLFYDKNLSANQKTSCASCHNQGLGFADDKAKSKGFLEGDTRRNAPNIADIPFTIHWRGLLWDKRATELEEMVQLPIEDEVEMGMNFSELITRLESLGYYDELFQKAYGSSSITQARISNAISDFVRVLLPLNSKLDQGIATNFANFTPQEIQGRQLFMSDCWHCHTSVPARQQDINLTSAKLFAAFSYPQNNGLAIDHTSDAGMGGWTNDPTDAGRFSSPSLKNVALTAPYMHDGSLATLEAVVKFYSEEIKPDPNASFAANNVYGWSLPVLPFTGFDYTAEEQAALVAFLRTLTDETFTHDPRLSDPFVASESTAVVQNDPTLLQGIYPNPMQERATIAFENPQRQLTQIRLYNLQGAVLRVGATTEQQYVLDRNELPAGQYVVSVEQENRRAVHKLIVP